MEKLIKTQGRAEQIKLFYFIFLLQVQTLKVLVNLSSNPDMVDDIVQAQVRLKTGKLVLSLVFMQIHRGSVHVFS